MLSFEDVYVIFSRMLVGVTLIIILSHVLNSWFNKLKPLVLKENSTVIITGGCMGIGKEMALQIARNSHSTIMIIDRRKDLFESVAAELTKLGSRCECYACDLGSDDSVQKTIQHIQQRYHKIDLFIYNAGVIVPKRTYEITHQEHQFVMKVNYFTPIQMIHAFKKQIEGGHVAVTASMAAIISGGINVSTYSASKHAIFAYLSSLRQQYKKDKINITVSIGCPYAINTTMFQGFRTKLDFLFRILDEKYVGQRLVRQFIQRKEVCYMYEYQSFLFKIIELFPSTLVDYCAMMLDKSDFQNIKHKHDHLIPNVKQDTPQQHHPRAQQQHSRGERSALQESEEDFRAKEDFSTKEDLKMKKEN